MPAGLFCFVRRCSSVADHHQHIRGLATAYKIWAIRGCWHSNEWHLQLDLLRLEKQKRAAQSTSALQERFAVCCYANERRSQQKNIKEVNTKLNSNNAHYRY
jgi:hypothetical protein